MGRRLGLGLVIAFLSGGVLSSASIALSHADLAPADEYFGPTKMSPLEITNRINDAERHGASYRGLMTTQTAIEDWTHKYPGDPWIPQREYRMSHLFAHLHSHDGNAEAAHCRTFMRQHFPGEHYTIAAEHEGGTQVAKAPAKTGTAHTSRKTPAKKKKKFLGIF
jgi:hypothetical protein